MCEPHSTREDGNQHKFSCSRENPKHFRCRNSLSSSCSPLHPPTTTATRQPTSQNTRDTHFSQSQRKHSRRSISSSLNSHVVINNGIPKKTSNPHNILHRESIKDKKSRHASRPSITCDKSDNEEAPETYLELSPLIHC